MKSFQITGIQDDVWRAFRRMCLEEGISANRKLFQLIESEVRRAENSIRGNVELKEGSHGRG